MYMQVRLYWQRVGVCARVRMREYTGERKRKREDAQWGPKSYRYQDCQRIFRQYFTLSLIFLTHES